MKYYSVFRVYLTALEKFLNDLEDHASDKYEIISIVRAEKSSDANINDIVAVVVRFNIDDSFNAEEIKKALGF